MKITATENMEAVVNMLIFSSDNPFRFIHFSMIHFIILNLDFLSIISAEGFSSKTAFCPHLCQLYVYIINIFELPVYLNLPSTVVLLLTCVCIFYISLITNYATAFVG